MGIDERGDSTADGERALRRRSDRWIVVGPVVQFVAIGLLAVVVVGFTTSVASRRVGERKAIAEARTTTLVKAQGLVEPVVTDALPDGDPAAVAKVAEVVPRDVLDQSLVRVKIWTAGGRIVYSDEPRIRDSVFPLDDEERTALDRGVIEADVSDLSKPENRFERRWKKLLEVYLPIRTPNGQRVLFEAYFRYNAVSSSGSRIWRSFAPISLGGLVVLELLQIPLAWSLARRLRQRQQERERLLQQALQASEVERRRVAGDLHDGAVQELAGVAFSLAGAARRDDLTPEASALFEESGGAVRSSIAGLRSLLVDIYPPDLEQHGLVPAVADLLAGIRAQGLATSLKETRLPESLSREARVLLYRGTREALRNVVTHARATNVRVCFDGDDSRASVEVTDDGVGFDVGALSTRVAEGHLGIKALDGVLSDAGGNMEIRSATGEGTTVKVEVPVR